MKLPRSRRRDEDMLKEQYGAHYIAPVDGEDKAQRKVRIDRMRRAQQRAITQQRATQALHPRRDDEDVLRVYANRARNQVPGSGNRSRKK